MLNMAFIIFLTPFWSASTEAYQKGEIDWIKNGVKRYNQLTALLLAIGVIMLIFSSAIYRFWLGDAEVDISFALSLWGYLYFTATIFGGTYVYFLNSINALRLQFFASLVSPLLYIGLAIVLIKVFHFGVYALFIASFSSLLNLYSDSLFFIPLA